MRSPNTHTQSINHPRKEISVNDTPPSTPINKSTTGAASAAPVRKRRSRKPKGRPKLRLAALMDALGISCITEFADRAGVARPTVYRWRDNGLDPNNADRLAIELVGQHPYFVFGEAWFELDDVSDTDDCFGITDGQIAVAA